MTCGWSTPRRSSEGVPARLRNARDLARCVQFGYCSSHSRFFWGLRLHLSCTLGGLPITYALTGAKADERQPLLGILEADPALVTKRPGLARDCSSHQTIESINQTFKGQLDLERHDGRTPAGVIVRILQRILALTAAIWHDDKTGQPVKRSLTAYDHCPLESTV
jgi:hypothetical protein